jgi:polyphosphate kinase 2 (PPK2 family)
MLILLEGMDKVGKSTVATHFVYAQNFDYIHMSAPDKTLSNEQYFQFNCDLIDSTAGKNVVIDRTWFGELIWPQIYNREPKLAANRIFQLQQRVAELHSFVLQVYMYDANVAAHQQRLREYKEPSYDYDKVAAIYKAVMQNHNFNFLTFSEAEALGWTK